MNHPVRLDLCTAGEKKRVRLPLRQQAPPAADCLPAMTCSEEEEGVWAEINPQCPSFADLRRLSCP